MILQNWLRIIFEFIRCFTENTCLGFIFIFQISAFVKNDDIIQVNLDMTDHCMTDFCI